MYLTALVVLSMMSATTLVGRTRTFVISHLGSVSTEFAGGTVTITAGCEVLFIQNSGKRSTPDFWTTRSAS